MSLTTLQSFQGSISTHTLIFNATECYHFRIHCIGVSSTIIIMMCYLMVLTEPWLVRPCVTAQPGLVLQITLTFLGGFMEVMCHMSLIIDNQCWITPVMGSSVQWCVTSEEYCTQRNSESLKSGLYWDLRWQDKTWQGKLYMFVLQSWCIS